MLKQYLRILDTLREKKFSETVRTYRETFIEKLNSELFSQRLRDYLILNPEGEPFTLYPADPAPVAQVKRIINALYYAELALQEAERTELRADASLITNLSRTDDLRGLYYRALSHAYRAAHLATHFDIDVLGIFSQEIAALAPLFTEFFEYTQQDRNKTWGRLAKMDRHKVSHRAGFLTGVVIDQLDPQATEPDYESLVPALADHIPQVLAQLTTLIEGLSSSITSELPSSEAAQPAEETGPIVDERKLEELQDHALQLLDALDGARASSMFLPLQALYYIHAISNTITLTVNIFKQMGKLSRSYQDGGRTKLQELKTMLALALGLADKIEEHSMLQPGTLSNPLATQASRLYQVLISYAEKFVEFSEHPSLRTLDDPEFLAERLSHSYDRIVTDTKALLMLEEVKAANAEFFRILNSPHYRSMHIADLPEDIRTLLTQHYKLLQSYVIQTYNSSAPYTLRSYIPLNHGIINGLNGLRVHGATVGRVLSLQPDLNALLEKLIISHRFYLDVKTDLISSIVINVQDLKLFTHSQRISPFAIDERAVLGNKTPEGLLFDTVGRNNQVRSPQNLTTAQATALYSFYQIQCAKLDTARSAYEDFIEILETPFDAPAAMAQEALIIRKRKLRNLYNIFQPYIENVDLLSLDESIIAALSSEEPQARDSGIVERMRPAHANFMDFHQRLHTRKAVFERVMLECTRVENQAKPLVVESTTARAQHVLKHQDFSTNVAKLRLYLSQQIPLFNAAVRDHLAHNPAENTLPFPNLDDANQRLAQSSQLVAFKQIFNCLYYLEKIVLALEELSDNTTEITYTFKILEVIGYAAQAYTILESLAKTPHLVPIVEELQRKLLEVKGTLTGLQGQYFPEPTPPSPGQEVVATHKPIFYAVNTMLFLPAHIIALRANGTVEPNPARKIHEYAERVTTDLERIISKSGSYLKLSSEVFTMYRLFWDLKAKLLELTKASHETVCGNLSYIKDELFLPILVELELWEDSVCLEPGSLTQPVAEMFDAFYKGLLDPLGLESAQHVSLVTSVRPIVARKEVVEERLRKAKFDRAVAQEQQQLLRDLLTNIGFYKDAPQGLLHAYEKDLFRSFHSALPILNKESELLSVDILPGNEADEAFDDLLMESVKVENPRLKNIEALITACLNKARGVEASQQLVIDTSEGKLAYLNNLLLAQPDLKDNFLDLYAAASFKKKQHLALNAQRVGLVDSRLRKEYADALEKRLQEAEVAILAKAKADPNIDNKISELIQAEIEKFYNQHYRNYCHLDGIIGAVTRLRRYVDGSQRVLNERGSHVFEGQRSLDNKKREIRKLEDYCYQAISHENSECGLVKMQTDPTQTPFANIEPLLVGGPAGAPENAVILYNNEIYYADVTRKEVSRIVVGPEKQGDLDKLKSKFGDAHKFADETEFSLISSLRGRTPVVSERIDKIQRYLNINWKTFQRTMCGYQHNNFLTLAWLQHKIAWLFELVGIYTPERKAGYQQLIESVAKPPENASHLGMLGIFSTERRRGYALRARQQPAAGVEQPAPVATPQPVLA